MDFSTTPKSSFNRSNSGSRGASVTSQENKLAPPPSGTSGLYSKKGSNQNQYLKNDAQKRNVDPNVLNTRSINYYDNNKKNSLPTEMIETKTSMLPPLDQNKYEENSEFKPSSAQSSIQVHNFTAVSDSSAMESTCQNISISQIAKKDNSSKSIDSINGLDSSKESQSKEVNTNLQHSSNFFPPPSSFPPPLQAQALLKPDSAKNATNSYTSTSNNSSSTSASPLSISPKDESSSLNQKEKESSSSNSSSSVNDSKKFISSSSSSSSSSPHTSHETIHSEAPSSPLLSSCPTSEYSTSISSSHNSTQNKKKSLVDKYIYLNQSTFLDKFLIVFNILIFLMNLFIIYLLIKLICPNLLSISYKIDLADFNMEKFQTLKTSTLSYAKSLHLEEKLKQLKSFDLSNFANSKQYILIKSFFKDFLKH